MSLVPLSEAREPALAKRKAARAGGDPLQARRDMVGVPTFAQAVQTHLEKKGSEFSSPKHRDQWRSTLDTYSGSGLGARRLDEITAAEVLRVLEPI